MCLHLFYLRILTIECLVDQFILVGMRGFEPSTDQIKTIYYKQTKQTIHIIILSNPRILTFFSNPKED